MLREQYWEGEIAARRADGSVFAAHSRFNLHAGGEQMLFSLIQVDVIEQKRLETEARVFEQKMIQTARLESVGLLAGGIAHDFNNLLTGILGNASLVMEQMSPSSPLRHAMEDVIKASERAADLTRQLLAYSGKGRFVMHVIRLNELLHEINSLVRLSISRNVRVEIETGVPMAVEADGAQLQQLLMNIIINAAEAIGEDRPGLVTVRTALETVSKSGEGLASGEYCAIEVEDNGSGMDAETIAHIFEPFFTTKFTGRGLGLAAATGIVHGHHGSLTVRSTPGAGSVFRVLLPGVPVQAPSEPAEIPVPVALTGHGTVLIIDDEEPVRKAVKNTLDSTASPYCRRITGSGASRCTRPMPMK